jgi:hypothetical protein
MAQPLHDEPRAGARRSLGPPLRHAKLDLLPILHELLRTRSV